MENEIKLTKKQIKEMDALMRAEQALITAERVHIAAMVETNTNLNDSKRRWWLAVAGERVGVDGVSSSSRTLSATYRQR
jgi:hypothetical protein